MLELLNRGFMFKETRIKNIREALLCMVRQNKLHVTDEMITGKQRRGNIKRKMFYDFVSTTAACYPVFYAETDSVLKEFSRRKNDAKKTAREKKKKSFFSHRRLFSFSHAEGISGCNEYGKNSLICS